MGKSRYENQHKIKYNSFIVYFGVFVFLLAVYKECRFINNGRDAVKQSRNVSEDDIAWVRN